MPLARPSTASHGVVAVLAAVLLATVHLPSAVAQEPPTVAEVPQGDVVVLSDGRRVPLLGVNGLSPSDTTEIAALADRTPLSASDLRSLGRMTRRYTADLVKGRRVELQGDSLYQAVNPGDAAYVWVLKEDGSRAFMLNTRLLLDGFGLVRTAIDYRQRTYFRAYEAEARQNNRGLWRSSSALPSFSELPPAGQRSGF